MSVFRKRTGFFTGIFGVLLLVVGFVVATNGTVSAADESRNSITVSPAHLDIPDMKPGTKYSGEYKLWNSGQNRVNVKIYAQPMTIVDDESYTKSYEQDGKYTQISKWITFDQDKYTLDPEERVMVHFYIDVPKDVPAGGEYAGIMNEMTADNIDGSGIVSVKRIGLNVYSNVAGNTRKEGDVVSRNVAFFQPDAPLEAEVKVKNNGNVDFAVKASMEVKSIFGKVLYSSEPTDLKVLPDTTRTFKTEWEGAEIGLYQVTVTPEFLDDSHASTHWVLVIPIWAILLAVFILVAIVLFNVTHKKGDKKKKDSK
jgi:preprotein translocase subunit SecG